MTEKEVVFSVPCKDCERQGCGGYHDHCELYQKYRAYRDSLGKEHEKRVKAHITGKKYRMPENSILKTHRR